jgi:tRNA(Arg) A34 adenosine deaminase TadA
MDNLTLNEKFMKMACEIASDNVINGGGPFGCVIVDSSNNIVSKGKNMVTILNDPTAHAEVVAIRNSCTKVNSFNLNGCTLYTSCEPCPMCLSAIYWSRIDNVYYGNSRTDAKNIGFDDEFIYDEFSKNIDDRKVKMKRCYETYAIHSFQLWSNKKDKIEY